MSHRDRRVRRRAWVPTRVGCWHILAALVVLAAAGCSTSSSSTSATSASSSPSHRPVCQTSQLRASFTNEQGSTGHYHATLVFTNTATTACSLSGYPALQLLGPGNQPLTTSVSPDPSLGAPRPVRLAPTRRASTPLTWVEIPTSPGEPCATPVQVQIIPPGNVQALQLAWPPEHNLVCGGGVIQAGAITAGVPLD